MQINRVQNNNPSFKAVKLENLSAPLKRAVVESPAIKGFIESNEKRLLNTEIFSQDLSNSNISSSYSRFVVRSVVPHAYEKVVDELINIRYLRYPCGAEQKCRGEQAVINAIKEEDAAVGLQQKVKEFFEWAEALSKKYTRE